MLILAHDGQRFARLQFNVGPRGSMNLPVEVDYGRPFQASDHAAWQEEYVANVEAIVWPTVLGAELPPVPEVQDDWGLFNDLFDDEPGFAPGPTERRLGDDC